MRMKEEERNLIIMKCDAGEYRVCVWAFTGESLSFFIRYLSATKGRLLFDSRNDYLLYAYNASAARSSWIDEYFLRVQVRDVLCCSYITNAKTRVHEYIHTYIHIFIP